MKLAHQGPPAIWLAFVRAGLGSRLVGGFGLGGTPFVASALLWVRPKAWWAAAQAHGQAQLLGWAGW